MRRRGPVVAALVVGAAGFACGSPPAERQPVVLWETGVVVPRFPVVPEAAWEPVHQRLRRQLEPGVGDRDLLVCYGVADVAAAVGFYAEVYGVEPGEIPWRPIPAAVWSAQQAALAAELGVVYREAVPPTSARRAELPQRGDLPALVLENPRRDAATGELVEGALACLRWSPSDTAGSS